MKTLHLHHLAKIATGLTLALTVGTTTAAVVLDEDFESPVVSPTSGATLNNGTLPDNGNWVGSDHGFNARHRGITNKAGGDFSAPGPNDQAFAFRYTNSGLTTAEGVLGNFLLGFTVNTTFDVVRDSGAGATGTPYSVQLIAFAPGAPRDDARSTPAGSTVLASLTGDAGADGLFDTINFNFTPDPGLHAGEVGKDLGIRFIGATNSAIIDNVSVDISIIPEPGRAALAAFAAFFLVGRRRR